MLTGGGLVKVVRNGICGEADGETEVEVLGGECRGVEACWKETRLGDFLSESSVDLLSLVADALVREGRAGSGFRGGRGLYRSEGGIFAGGGGPGNSERYSDNRLLAGPVMGRSSMDSSFRTSAAIGTPSFSM